MDYRLKLMSDVLKITNLSVSFDTPAGSLKAVRDVSFSLKEGEILAIVGESGCGKSALLKSIIKLLPKSAKCVSNGIFIDNTDISGYNEKQMQAVRGSLISMVFQDPMTSLDPTLPIGRQIAEAIKAGKKSQAEVQKRVIELLTLVGIENPAQAAGLYPHNFSGGMRQRIVIAIALASNPRVLFADEPTTALDVTIQAQILDLLKDIQSQFGTSTILVTHDLGVVARVADRVAIMYAGKIIEIGTAGEVFYDSRHPYTWALMKALPVFADREHGLFAIPGMPPTLINPIKGDAFASRNIYALDIDYEEEPPMYRLSDTHFAATWLLDKRAPKVLKTQKVAEKKIHSEHEHKRYAVSDEIMLDIRHLTHKFPIGKRNFIKAVDDLSLSVRKGEIFGLVGESGSGKSTVARCIMNIYNPAEGSIIYNNIDVCDRRQFRKNKKILQMKRHMIFQDSASSLNQKMKVCDIITEPLVVNHIRPKSGSMRTEALRQLKYVGLEDSYVDSYPSQLSGGMRQRVAIARALILQPDLLVADEPIASLDVSIQAQIINLFRHLQREHGFTFIFIAHDLSVVRYLCDTVGVMYHGKLVEVASTEKLFQNPEHPYTRNLLSAIPLPDPRNEKNRKFEIYRENA